MSYDLIGAQQTWQQSNFASFLAWHSSQCQSAMRIDDILDFWKGVRGKLPEDILIGVGVT